MDANHLFVRTSRTLLLLWLLIVACLLLEQLTDKWACIRRNCASDMQVDNPLPGRGAPHSAGNLIINPVLDRQWSAHTQRSTLLQLTRAFQNPSFPRSLRNSLSMLLTSWNRGIPVLCIEHHHPTAVVAKALGYCCPFLCLASSLFPCQPRLIQAMAVL